MPTNNHHVILRSRIEITTDKHSQNQAIRHAVHKTVAQRLIPTLSKLFSQHVPDDVVIHLDKLVIDGGALNLSNLSKQLPHQIEQILMPALKEQIGKIMHNPNFHQVTPLPEAKQQAIEHYLSEGNFAWWMTERSEKQIEKIYLELLHHAPLLIEQLWHHLKKKERAIQRCITCFSGTTVENTLSLLLKQPIKDFTPILAETGVLLHQTGILTDFPYTPQRQLLSMALLGMINQQRPKIDRMGFLTMLLKQVATKTSTSYEKILEKLQTYYAQREGKSPTLPYITKEWVLQLRDMVITPPKFWNKAIKNQETVLKELDKIGNSTMAPYQLSATIDGIKAEVDKPGIRSLIKSWLKEPKNRAQLIQKLPDTLFASLLESIDPFIMVICSDLTQILADTTSAIAPAYAVKEATLAYCAFEQTKMVYFKEVKELFSQYVANSVIDKQRFATLLTTEKGIYRSEVEAMMAQLVSLSKTTIEADLTKTTMLQYGIHDAHQQLWTTKLDYLLDNAQSVTKALLENILFETLVHPTFISGWQEEPLLAAYKAKLRQTLGSPTLSNILQRMALITDAADRKVKIKALIPTLQRDVAQQITTQGAQNPFSDVTDFLIHHTLPKDQPSPAYLIAKYLGMDPSKQMRHPLAPLGQETASLKKLIPYETKGSLRKLLQTFLPFPTQRLNELERVVIQAKVVQSTPYQTTIHLIKEIFVTAAIVHPPTTEKQYIEQILRHLRPHTPFCPTILCDRLAYTAEQTVHKQLAKTFAALKKSLAPPRLNKVDKVDLKVNHNSDVGTQPLDSLEKKYLHTDDDIDIDAAATRVAKSPLSDVVTFLTYNELPKDQSVPAYWLAKRLENAAPEAIRNQLIPLCQEAVILKKLMQHATEVTLHKLFQALIPFSTQRLDELERVIIQAKVLQSTEQQTNIRLIKEIFIKAAIVNRPPATEKQYIERILLHLGAHTPFPPTVLCDQLAYTVEQAAYSHLVETFSGLKKKLALLNLNKIDELDLIFLSTHEAVPLDKALLPLYYSKLLPAIKNIVAQPECTDLSQADIKQLVTQHLPTLSETLQQTISRLLSNHIEDTVQGIRAAVTQRWHLFLHTGKLGNDADVAALLKDVIKHLPTFSLEQDKIHVRQRLIAHFTHSQLLLLIQKHSHVGKELAHYIEGIYQLWSATQGSLGQQSMAKNLFWDVVLATLPHASIPKDDWTAQIITQLGHALEITPTTLLQTFKLIIRDTKGVPEVEVLTISLNNLQAKQRQSIQKQAIQSGCKEAVLEKLYLLLNGGLSLFAEQYDLAIHKLEHELVQLMVYQPSALPTMLGNQDQHALVARRMVHYFSKTVVTKIIACIAKEKHAFVMTYLHLLSHPPQHEGWHLPHLPTWNKELSISLIDYLMTTGKVDETELVHSTLLTLCYAKEEMRKIITSIVATKPTNQEEDKIITLLKPLLKIKDASQSTASQPTLAHTPLENRQATAFMTFKTKEKPQQVDLPEKEVRVYTKNAGLVFLWPFLYDFFKGQNIMMGNQFSCEQAVHNAVYLLQYLVIGKLKSPEWQLTLPKLLCGLPYDEVLLPYRHIDQAYDTYSGGRTEMEAMVAEVEKEQEAPDKTEADGLVSISAMEAIETHSQLLIEKAIARWQGLTKLKEVDPYQESIPPDLFKSYFLNRLGILLRQPSDDTTEKKYWHLTIMHQDHDHPDLLPPWSMHQVKLPWMQEAIILFWMPQ